MRILKLIELYIQGKNPFDAITILERGVMSVVGEELLGLFHSHPGTGDRTLHVVGKCPIAKLSDQLQGIL